MFGHDCDLVAIHTEDFSLEVDQLPLTHFHIVPGLEVMLSLLTCRNSPQPTAQLHITEVSPQSTAEDESYDNTEHI